MLKCPPDNDPEQHRMPLVEHLLELRRRLLLTVIAFLVAFLGCFYLAGDIYGFLVRPLAAVMEAHGGSQRMIYTAITEAFFTYLKVAAFAAFFITFPVLATQLWLFIAPGLYKNEKRAFLPFLIATPILFLLGAGLVYMFVMPFAWQYMLSFQSSGADTMLPIQLEAKVSEYLDVVMTLMLAFGTCFELPVALTLMAKVGLVSAQGLAEKRQFAIVGVFIASAILTPPDVISQIGLALPLIGLYELAILSCRWMETQRAKGEQQTEQH